MVAEHMTSIERSWSSQLFSPTTSKVVGHFPHSGDTLDVDDRDGFTSYGNGVAKLHSSLRRRSQSQNQLRRTLNSAVSPPLYDKPNVAPLRLKNLPLASFSVASSPLKSSSRPVQLASLKRSALVLQPLEKKAAVGNQEESTLNEPEERASTMTTTSKDTDNQLDHQLNSLIENKTKGHIGAIPDSGYIVETPEASPRETTFLPRLATLDINGDARYLLRHSSSSSTMSPRTRHWTRVERICDEIVTTERSYVRDLRILLRHFFTPLQEYAIKYTISLGAISALHASIRTILHIHNELLRQIACTSDSSSNRPSDVDKLSTNEGETEEDNESEGQDGEDDWLGMALTASTLGHDDDSHSTASVASVSQVAHAFNFTIEFMKVYAFYCSSYLSAKDELALLQKEYPGLNALTTQLGDHARRDLRVDIVSLMIKPVQRICRYPLLFRELLKHAVSSDQAEVVESTLYKIEGVSTHVNEKVREAQNNARLYELHQTIDPKAKIDLLQPSRTLLSEMLVRVVSLDAPCWPSFLLSLGRRRPRRCGQHSEASSRRDSVLEPACTPLLSPQSPHSSGSFTHSSISSTSSSSSMQPPLLRRGSSGEKLRLILLSDVLLMAKKQEEKLKIKRQFCLSCANVVDTTDSTNSTTIGRPQPWSFVMEVAKVGRCNCHQLTPVTLKRSPKRRSSLSLSLSSDLLGALQPKQSPQPTASHHQQVKPSGFFRGSEFASPLFRSAKRYSVICESEQKKNEFLAILRNAIARCARVQPAKSAFPSVSEAAAKLPGRFWRSLKPQQSPPAMISKSSSEQILVQEDQKSDVLALDSSVGDPSDHQLRAKEDSRAQTGLSLV